MFVETRPFSRGRRGILPFSLEQQPLEVPLVYLPSNMLALGDGGISYLHNAKFAVRVLHVIPIHFVIRQGKSTGRH